MNEIIIAIIGLIGTIIPSVIAYKKSKVISRLSTEHERAMNILKVDHEKEMEKIQSQHVLELEMQKNTHDREMQEIKHNHEMEVMKFQSNINTNSSEGLNDVLNVMQNIGMNPADLINNPEKIKKQMDNINSIAFVKKK